MSLPHARAIAALTAAALLAAGCNDNDPKKQPGLEWKPLATAKPGQVVSIIGRGSTTVADSRLPAWRNSIGRPTALAEGANGEVLILQRSGSRPVVAVSPQGRIRDVGPVGQYILGQVWSMVRLSDGDLATVSLAGAVNATEILLGRIGSGGKLSDWARVKTSTDLVGVPGLAPNLSGEVLVMWDGKVWKEQDGQLTPHSLPVSGAVRAVADGKDLLVATQESVHRVRGGRVVSSHPIRPSGQRWEGGYVTAIVPDSKGGSYVAVGPEGPSADLSPPGPSVIFHVPATGAPNPVAFGDSSADCDGPISGKAQGSTPLEDPRALLVRGDQLLIADMECNHVFAVGLSVTAGS